MKRLLVVVSAGLLTAVVTVAGADVFVLTNGGRLEGELLNPNESPRVTYVVRLESGGRVTLRKSQVRGVIGKSPEERRYEELLPQMPDTVDGHWKMAEWCLKNNLKKQRKFHLEQILKRDPDHEEARRILGYIKRDGVWTTQEEWMQAQGYVRYGGQWRTPQVVQLEKQREQIDLAEGQWRRKLKIWRSSIGGKRHEEAVRQIRAIRDPLAARALAEFLDREPRRDIKQIYIDTLGRLDSAVAVDALVRAALEDDDADIRDQCLDRLKSRGTERAVIRLVGQLTSKDNRRINRAAVGLGRLNDPSAIRPLIDALVTEHKVVIGSGRSGQIGATFPTGGTSGGGLSVGGGSRVRTLQVHNRAVLDALLALTDGVNYQYDEESWKSWYARTKTPEVVNLRRDP